MEGDAQYEAERDLESWRDGRDESHADDGDECPACGSELLRHISIQCTEPHGETFHDEGLRCVSCGATQMQAVEPVISGTPDELISALLRSVRIASGLQAPAAFRMGVALAAGKQKKEVA